uniref:Uncharacterized protein n=1 Tax=Nelumbo nucifera TaxID=4432 RepID=A0A822Z6N1_NELNU|nr:TPA_asm: hypothetical protein HUJ06_014566 [Nelumbo nucifera]
MIEEMRRVMADDDVLERNDITGNHQQDMIKVQSQNSPELGSEAQACKWEALVRPKQKWILRIKIKGIQMLNRTKFSKELPSGF